MAVVFDVYGPMAMFRKPYTTTSSVSYAFPPPTAVAGLTCAITGIRSEQKNRGASAVYWRSLEGTSVAVRILRPIRWNRQTVNLWNVKNPEKNAHIQVKHQFLFDPGFRVFVRGPLEEKLDEKIKSGSYVYTPSLGVAYALAEVKYVGRFEDIDPESDSFAVDTVVPYEAGVEIDVLQSGGAFKEVVPFKMDDQRKLLKSATVLYSSSPSKKLIVRERGELDVTKSGEDMVAWFPSW